MLVNVTSYGQLGNRLQLFAHLIAFGIENNVKVVNLGFKEYAHYFTHTNNDIFCRYPAHSSFFNNDSYRKFLYTLSNKLVKKKYLDLVPSSLIQVTRCYPYSENEMEFRLDDLDFIKSVRNTKISILHGYYFVDYLNLLKHANTIRQYFRPLDAHEQNVKQLITKARNSCDILIGIHIRLGDYKNFQGGKFYYDIDVFLKLMHQSLNLYPNKKVGFLICSDESHSEDKFQNFNTIRGNGQIIEDMYSLAACDYIVGTPSTYSRWACFYGETPAYHILDPQEQLDISKFQTYEDIVLQHIKTASIFPHTNSSSAQQSNE